MGVIKYKNIEIFNGPIANVDFIPGWDNDMQTYYPHIYITINDNGAITRKTIHLEENSQKEYLQVTIDPADAGALLKHDKRVEAIRRKALEEKLLKTIEKDKMLKIIAGRKIPKGSAGVCFWVGDTLYGKNVGIMIDGKKVFTSIRNVEVCLDIVGSLIDNVMNEV